jgi:hypothetical protein
MELGALSFIHSLGSNHHIILIYCHDLGCVTIDGVWIGELALFTTCIHHPELHFTSNTVLLLIPALHSSLLQTLVLSVYYSFHDPLPGNGFNTGTITVSL